MSRHPLSYGPLERFLKGFFIVTFFMVVYLWVSADAWEESMVAEQLAQERIAVRDLTVTALEEEEVRWSADHQPRAINEPAIKSVTRSVKRNTVKAKRKIKRALKRNN